MSKLLYEVEGVVKRHPDGFGFLIPSDRSKKDVFLPKHTMEGVMSNDRALVKVFYEARENNTYGEILKITERFTKKLVGIFHSHNEEYGWVLDKENHWGQDLKIFNQDQLSAKEGEWVEIEVLSFPGHPKGFTGKIKKVIGNANDPLYDTKRVIASHQIPDEFSEETLKEVSHLSPQIDLKGSEGRRNLRSLNFVTIDGVTAKDFDDAIYVETNTNGFHLWVAIADVSHYVKPDTALDKDAYEKGNSSYFPMFVVPMLPEILSNELCSLKPKVDRFALVAEIQLSYRGDILSTEFYEAIINSKARVTYGEAQEILDGETPKGFEHVAADILRAGNLAKILMSKRYQQGSLDLEIPETEVILDELGNPIDIIRSERVFAHKLIEELMLAANISVGKFFEDKSLNGIFRIHESPDPEKLNILQSFLKTFGTETHLEGTKLQKKITKALKRYEGRPEMQILSQLTLRSMKQARYSSENLGHFGLCFSHYTHFTSPIRRYPDLIVHRIIKGAVYGPKHNYPAPPAEFIDTAAVHCSATEQRSVKAERMLTSIKKARFAQKLIGEELEGTIASVTKFGIFVSLRQFDVEGLVRMENLGNDYFIFNEEKLCLTGERSGYTYHMGQSVRVLVSAANSELGQIDFNLISSAFTPRKNKEKKSFLRKKTDKKAHTDHKEESPRGKKGRRPPRNKSPKNKKFAKKGSKKSN